MNDYYVYVYLDTRKPNIEPDCYGFDYEPIYVGKGRDKRAWQHLYKCNNRNELKYRKIRKIIKDGFIPKIVFYKENLSESDAFIFEKELISKIGTIAKINNVITGPLTNLTAGGEGFYPSEETKRKYSQPGSKNPMYGRRHTEDSKKLISEHSKKLKHTDETRKKMSDARKGSKNARSVSWVLQLPDGCQILIDDLKGYCKDNNLPFATLYSSYYAHKKPIKSGIAAGYWLKEKAVK